MPLQRLLPAVACACAVVAAALVTPSAASAAHAPRTDPCSVPRRALLIGDSLVARSTGSYKTAFAARGWSVGIVAHGGKPTQWGAYQVRTRGANPRMPSTIVIALGTNDTRDAAQAAGMQATIEAIADLAGPTRTVLWVDVALSQTNPSVTHRLPLEATVNAAIDAAVLTRTNVHRITWSTLAQTVTFTADGVHLIDAAAYDVRADFIADAVLNAMCPAPV